MSELKQRVYKELGLDKLEAVDDVLANFFKYTAKESFDAAYDNNMADVNEDELAQYLDLATKLKPKLEAMYIQFLEFASEFANNEEGTLQ